MEVLIIGAHGFIGSHLVEYFTNLHHSVTLCSTKPDQFLDCFVLSKDDPNFEMLFKHKSFDLCINASGSSEVNFSIHHPTKDKFLNVEVTHRILKAIEKYQPETKFIHLSSVAVYGEKEHMPISEEDATTPFSPYGQHKLDAERLSHQFDLPIIHCRIFSVYGPRLRKQLFWDLYQKSQHDDVIQLFGTGEESRDYIYIQDLMHAFDCIIQHASFNHQVINIGNGSSMTTHSAASEFLNMLNCHKTLVFNDQPKRGDPQHYCANIEKLTQYHYRQKTNFNQGLEAVVTWLEKI